MIAVVPRTLLNALAGAYKPVSKLTPKSAKTEGRASKTSTEAPSRCAAYIAKVGPAISGDHGHDRTFQVARTIWNDFGLDEADGYAILEAFNAKCEPPWSDKELRHKWDDAVKKGPGPEGRGYKLSERPQRSTSSQRETHPTRASEGTSPSHMMEGGNTNNQDHSIITIDSQSTTVASTMRAITKVLVDSGDCYRRAGQAVRISDGSITPILTPSELAGLLNYFVEFRVIGEKRAEYKPLPSSYANIWLNHPGESRILPVINLFTLNPVFTEDWRLASPGFDLSSGIYYAGPPVKPRPGTERLDTLLHDFCFRSPADRTNYVGMLITSILMPRFIGSKPAVLLSGNQPGLGKSILAQVAAIIRDGHPVETITYNPNDEELEKRLGATIRRGTTTVIIDNAKGKGRNKRIESACLERSITDQILSFRLLGSSSEIRAENSHLFCLTANTPDVSRDLVTRSVLVALFHEGDPARRSFVIDDPEGFALVNRMDLLGELVWMVENWKTARSPLANAPSRFNKKAWGPIVGGILAANGLTDFLANAETAAVELDVTRSEFAYLVGILVEHPQGTWTASELAVLVMQNGLFPTEFKDLSQRGQATQMGILAGRYVAEKFALDDCRTAVFCKADRRRGSVYYLELSQTC